MAEHGHKTNKNRKYDRNRKGSAKVYATQGRLAKNKARRLARHCANQPNDKQAAKVRDSSEARPIRKAPQSKTWRPSTIEFAHTLRQVGLNGNYALLMQGANPNPVKLTSYLPPPKRRHSVLARINLTTPKPVKEVIVLH